MERLVIDTETTGLSPRFNSLLTVGMLHIDVEKDFLKILDSSHIFIRHLSGSVNPQALKVNKINIEEHNKTAITPNSACKQINQFIDKNSLHKTLLVGHNLHFDRGFLSALYVKEHQDPIFHHEHEDTMYIWRNLQKKGIDEGSRNTQLLQQLELL